MTALLLSLASYGVAFVARPFGAALFGHFGDKLGRKWVLVVTLMLMGLRPSRSACCPVLQAPACWRRYCWCCCASCRAWRSAASGAVPR